MTLLLDHGADVHAVTEVGGYRTALGVPLYCILFVTILIFDHVNLIRIAS